MTTTAATCDRCGATPPPGMRFCGQCGAPLADAPPEERRWVTVLFADLVGFTTLSEDMDPEDVRVLVDEVMVRLVPIVQDHGGWVNRIIGDALLAVFGAPTAHEDDPERAVRAALAMLDEVAGGGKDPGALAIRVGVNTGDSMLGTVGADLTVMGDAVNIASRLQTAALPGQVLVGGSTRAGCGPALRFRAVGDLTVKGKQRTVAAYEPLAADEAPSRRRMMDTPLIGRTNDRGALVEAWQTVCSTASPHLVVLVGEAGLGKSRLAGELLTAVRAHGGRVLSGRCLPYGQLLGYRALAEAVDAWAGLDRSDGAAAARDKLAALAAELGLVGDETVEHLAIVAGVGEAGAQTAVNQVRLHATVRALLEAGARQTPTCLFVDDIHWADHALLDLLEGVAEKLVDVPLLVVTTARPELVERRPWWLGGNGDKPHERMTAVRLGPLDPLSSARLATALCGRHALPVERAEEIERAAGGNPLFAEEVAAVLALQSGGSGGATLPGSLQASIAARLDGLPPDERSLLQLASVVGLTFWPAALAALGAPEPEGLLDSLEFHGLAHRLERSKGHDDHRTDPRDEEDEWTFKHGLIRDVAYGMLSKARRRALHGALVDWMEAATGDRLEEYTDLLAHHAMAAERFDAALGYLDGAAERARRAAAHVAEADRLGEALEIAARLEREDLTAGLRARRGRARARLGAWADARAELEAALAAEVAPLAGETRAEVEVELSEVCFWLADTAAQRSHASAGLVLADEFGRSDLAAGAMAVVAQAQQVDGDLAGEKETFRAAIERAGGFSIGPLAGAPLAFYLAGDVVEALALAEQAAAAADEVRDIAFTMWALSYLGLTLAANGRYAEADTVYDRARRYGDEHGAKPLTCRLVSMSSGFRYDVGDTTTAVALAEEAVDRAGAVGFAPTFLQAKIDLLLAWARGGQPGRAGALVTEVEEGIETLNNWHEWLWRLRCNEAKAELALAAGDPEAAIAPATEALARARRHGRRKYEADALTSLGRAQLALGHPDDGLAHLRAALVVAEGVSDPALLLRVAAPVLAAGVDDEGAVRAEAAASDRIRAGLPAALRPTFEAYRERLVSAPS